MGLSRKALLRSCPLSKYRGSGVSEASEVATEQVRDGERVGDKAAEARARAGVRS